MLPGVNISAATGRYPERMPFTSMFERGDERLVLQRHDEEEGLALTITNAEGSRSVPFSDRAALVTFQTNMEQFLVRTGWSLATFAPERRRYTDHQTFHEFSPIGGAGGPTAASTQPTQPQRHGDHGGSLLRKSDRRYGRFL